MNIVDYSLKRLRDGLTAALPTRIVSEDFISFEERNGDETTKGIVTVLLSAVDPIDDWSCNLKLIIVGQLEVEQRDDSPKIIEQAEIKLWHELRRYLRNTGGLPRVAIEGEVRFSSQREFPYGWVLINATHGPIDEGCLEGIDNPEEIMPPGVNEGKLKSGHIDIDIRPHESGEEHKKWLQGNYSDSQPEAQIDMEFKHDAND